MPVDEELQKLRVMCSEHGVDPKGSKTQLEDRYALSRIDEVAALHKTLYESWKQSPLTSAVRSFILDERSLCSSLCELIDPNEHSNYSVSPKVWLRIAESLVHVHGVDPNSGDEYGVTTLHELAHDANLGSWPCSDTPLKPKLRKMAQWLLDEGARSDIEMKARRPYFGINSEGNKDYPAGTTPAHIAEGTWCPIRGAGVDKGSWSQSSKMCAMFAADTKRRAKKRRCPSAAAISAAQSEVEPPVKRARGQPLISREERDRRMRIKQAHSSRLESCAPEVLPQSSVALPQAGGLFPGNQQAGGFFATQSRGAWFPGGK